MGVRDRLYTARKVEVEVVVLVVMLAGRERAMRVDSFHCASRLGETWRQPLLWVVLKSFSFLDILYSN
jgi:hypothetical protein